MSIITRYAIQGADILNNNLTQSMLDYSKLLDPMNILNTKGMENSLLDYKEVNIYLVQLLLQLLIN